MAGKRYLIWLVVFIFALVGSSNAGNVTVFGPSQYTTTQGGTDVFTDIFSALASEALITVRNGTLTGTNRIDNAISSARVYVNGTEIFSPNDFNQNVYLLESPINVGGNNTISVELNGSSGRYLTIEIIQQVPEPTVTITANPDTIHAGNSSILTWNSTNADNCVISPRVGNVPVNGSIEVFPTETTTYTVTATGLGGSASANITVTVINTPPVANAGHDQSVFVGDTVMLDGSGSGDTDGDPITYLWSIVAVPNGSAAVLSVPGAVNPTFVPDVTGTYTLELVVNDSHVNSLPDSVTINAESSGGQLPPDPADVAPPLDQAAATPVYDQIKFLYTGNNPIQTGMSPETIDLRRAAVLRGLVRDRAGNPLPGVAVEILNHPEFGQTLTRTDGMFDLAVNGGGYLTVTYEKEGYLPVQRTTDVPWQDFKWMPDVVLIELDSQVTTVYLGSSVPMQVAQGSSVSDDDGTRQATLMFPQGTQAEMVLPDGSIQPITMLNVRASEYTVGPNGPQAMPGELPPTSGYTYAVELSVDEAMAAGAKRVDFSQPLVFYVENFLGFPVGGIVPTGYYDRDRAAWIPSDNGLIIQIISVSNGIAELDVNGSGLPADSQTLANLGITTGERNKLAYLYSPGESLWRVPITHFTPWDCNWPYGPPMDAEAPKEKMPEVDPKLDDPCQEGGSIIECENQVLGETTELTGTPFSLHYRSDRVRGRKKAHQVDIPLSGESIPASLKRIELEITVAGRKFTETFPALPYQNYVFTWDGENAYGQEVQGAQSLTIRTGYVYDAVYYQPTQFVLSFSRVSGIPLSGSSARQEITLWQNQVTPIGVWNALDAGMGGWTLNVHHAYDPLQVVLYLGNGERKSARNMASHIITTVAGNGYNGYSGDDGLATLAKLYFPNGVAVGPDGSFYIADSSNRRIRRVDPAGIITTVAGNGSSSGYMGDNEPAIWARLTSPQDIAVGRDGSLYISDFSNDSYGDRIRRVDPAGIITTVVGNGYRGYSGDNGPATAARLNHPYGVAVAPDGSLYIADSWNNRIRRVDPAGIIMTVAGNGNYGYSGDNGPATSAALREPSGVAVAPDGSLYIADTANSRIRRVDPAGIIMTVAGNGNYGYNGDNGPAIAAGLRYPHGIVVGPDGSLYITDTNNLSYNHRIRRVDPAGIITTVAGNGDYTAYIGDNGPATAAGLYYPNDVAVDHHGSLYIADTSNHRIRQLFSGFPEFDGYDIIISSEDGSELYLFNSSGKQSSTVNALTGAILYQFRYDDSGYLIEVEDADGNVTTIQRDVSGNPAAIIAPDGQRTDLVLNSNGYLSRITNPAGEAINYVYLNDGLLTSVTDSRGNTSVMTYDVLGRLIKDENAAGGFWQLSRTEYADGFRVDKTSALNRVTTYDVVNFPNGDLQRFFTSSNGITTETLIETNGTKTITAPDGTITVSKDGPDPRFKMQAPITKSLVITTPGGLSYNQTANQTVSLADQLDLLSLQMRTDTVSINGRTFTRVYNAAGRTFITTSPAGRQSSGVIDAVGRIVQENIPGLVLTNYSYDSRGRLTGISKGTGLDTRDFTFAYDTQGNLASITDPLSRTLNLRYDLAGRITRNILPDLREINYGYDANGNITAVTPPGRPAHFFDYTAVNLTNSYDPPDIGIVPDKTNYFYNFDKELTRILRPDNAAIDFAYDTTGQMTGMTIPGGEYTYAYNINTGKLASITDPDDGVLSFSYDGFLLKGETWGGTVMGAVIRNYNNNFWLTSLAVNGNAVNYGYDSDGLLTQAGSLTLSRNAQNGLLTGTAIGNVTTGVTHNGFAEVSSESVSYSGAPFYSASYVYDKLGRIIQKTETVDSTTSVYDYEYDLAGRLETVDKNGVAAATYAYDANGNRQSMTTSSGTANGVYDNQDRLVSYGNAAYAYSANGELETKTVGAETTTYYYDELGNLISVALPDGTIIDYIIDGRNRRVVKRINGFFTEGFLYQDQLNPVAKINNTGNMIARYVYADKSNVPAYMIQGGATYRIISDHLGSPRFVVNVNTGVVAQRMDYDEFGNVILDTNPGFQPFGFAGGLYDQHTKLTRFGVRDYDAETGRWTAKDPIRFAGGDTNLYGYVLSDSVNAIDPWGLLNPATGAGAAIGSFVMPGPGTIIGAVIGTGVGIIGGQILWDNVIKPLLNEGKDPTPPKNPAESPGEGWEWRGKDPPGGERGAWHNPDTGESLHPDLDHPAPIGPHWDYVDPEGNKRRLSCPK